MIKVVTSVTVFNDAIGKRMSVTYSEIDEQTGQIISDNKRADRVVTESSAKKIIDNLNTYAQEFIDNAE